MLLRPHQCAIWNVMKVKLEAKLLGWMQTHQHLQLGRKIVKKEAFNGKEIKPYLLGEDEKIHSTFVMILWSSSPKQTTAYEKSLQRRPSYQHCFWETSCSFSCPRKIMKSMRIPEKWSLKPRFTYKHWCIQDLWRAPNINDWACLFRVSFFLTPSRSAQEGV